MDLKPKIPSSNANTKLTHVASVAIGRIGDQTPKYPPRDEKAVVASEGNPEDAGKKPINHEINEYASWMMADVIMTVYLNRVTEWCDSKRIQS